MSRQIAVRLPDDVVDFVDASARSLRVSRAAVVTEALRERQRQVVAERDAEILRTEGDYADFEGLGPAAVLDDLS